MAAPDARVVACAAVLNATRRRGEAEAAWVDAVVGAAAAGCSRREIAGVAGVSHQRVQQLVAESKR